MKVLITGGVGFIGANAAEFFAKRNNEVVVVDNFSRLGVEVNAQHLQENYSQVKINKADVQDLSLYLHDLKQADLILHLAGQTAVTTSIDKPAYDFDNNLQAGFTLLEAVRQYNRQATVIFASTNKVYGDLSHQQLQKDQELQRYRNLTRPEGVGEDESLSFISPYGCSKGAVDQYFLDYARNYDLKTVVFRQSCIYGPKQMGVEDQGWVAFFARQFLNQLPITIFGDGYQVRDLLFVDDLLEAYVLAHEQIEVTAGEVFNIGGGPDNAYSLLQVLDLLDNETKLEVEINHDLARIGDQRWFVADNSKLQKLLNWQPKTAFKQGLKEMIAWQKKHLQ